MIFVRVVLELLRIIFIFGLLGAVGQIALENIYSLNEATESYAWLGGLAVFFLIFVLYRNKFQFFGWYEGKGRHKLPKKVTVSLVYMSAILIVIPFLFAFMES